MSAATSFAPFQTSKHLNMETFRKSGAGVRTPVWFAATPESGSPEALYVYSTADSGKAKRIRNNARVKIAPCDIRGQVSGEWVDARAEIVTGAEFARGMQLLNKKYFPWKQLLDFFAKFRPRGHVLFAIRPN